ncbi:macro domain-containing protein [Clostridioides sp. ZZV14-6153]|uniref:macro domain-containing protein n=1 Tax=Clostridioides sp. ZZV14-6153 TaxID=2811494 RepID=UPI001D1184FB|nr:hypothetical protein [Clostridioides sp. ZZV14-6153]
MLKKIKVNLFDKQVIEAFVKDISFISLIISFILIFVEIPKDLKIIFGIVFVIFLLCIYISTWIYANIKCKAILNINNSILEIGIADIFEEEDLKVIAFNEYFDTQVDNKVISETSLNGMFIKRYIDNVDDLDENIKTDACMNSKKIGMNESRLLGKKEKYKLGSVFEYNGYLLTAFSKFDNDNKAYLSMRDYIDFLLSFWDEIDRIYSGRTIAIPLLGSGITRFREYHLSEQELLELLIWSFKISRVKFTYPSKVKIIIYEGKKDKVNFYKLKGCQ